mgnify:FL=1|jgi:uncharacterized phiE125 gp8 family phage protein|tara:strand:- start:640 stop:1239 length:600 start_codon:yes stop_codon:yes gene_type:complete
MAIAKKRQYVSVQPAIEPISVEEARFHCDLDDNYFDEKLRSLIKAARLKVEKDTRRALINQTRVLSMDGFPAGSAVELLTAPVSSVTSVTYTTTAGVVTTLDSSKYSVDSDNTPGRVILGYDADWPDNRGYINDVKVTYVCGYGTSSTDVPETARQAMLLLIRSWFDNPAATTVSMFIPREIIMGYEALISCLKWGQYP